MEYVPTGRGIHERQLPGQGTNGMCHQYGTMMIAKRETCLTSIHDGGCRILLLLLQYTWEDQRRTGRML